MSLGSGHLARTLLPGLLLLLRTTTGLLLLPLLLSLLSLLLLLLLLLPARDGTSLLFGLHGVCPSVRPGIARVVRFGEELLW